MDHSAKHKERLISMSQWWSSELFPMTLELALDANVGASSSRFVFNCSSGADGAQSVSTIVIHLYLETAS